MNVFHQAGRRWRWAVLLLALAWTVACGYKTPPRSAQSYLPDRIDNLTWRVTESGRLAISFQAPRNNTRSQPLKDLGGFFIERAENQARPGFCSGCPVKYQTRSDLPARTPAPLVAVDPGPYGFQDRLEVGFIYNYRIMAHNHSGEYDPNRAAVLVVNYDTPPAAPQALTVRSEEGVVHLAWAQPERLTDGRPIEGLAGYEVYRRPEAAGGAAEPSWERLNPDAPWERNAFTDGQVTTGETYEYMVRAVRRSGETLISGPASIMVKTRPVDLTPPAPPVKVYAVSVREGVKLTWPAVLAPDLAGYRVYRADESRTGFSRVGPALLKENLFVDHQAVVGAVYYYRVTSVDASPAANESRPSAEIKVQHQP